MSTLQVKKYFFTVNYGAKNNLLRNKMVIPTDVRH